MSCSTTPLSFPRVRPSTAFRFCLPPRRTASASRVHAGFRGSMTRPICSLCTLHLRGRPPLCNTRFRLVATFADQASDLPILFERFPLRTYLILSFPLSVAYLGARVLAGWPGGVSPPPGFGRKRGAKSSVWRTQESGGAGRRHTSRRGRQRSASPMGSSIASGIQKRQLRLPHSKRCHVRGSLEDLICWLVVEWLRAIPEHPGPPVRPRSDACVDRGG
jgi:hypothetical protein